MYQLIAFDMDGTLLRSDHTIDPETVAALGRADEAGKTVVLATGRSASELQDYLPVLPMVRYGVLASGGLIYDFSTETVLAKKSLSAEVVATVCDLLDREDVFVVVMADGQGYVQSSQFNRIEAFYMEQFRQLYLDTAVFVSDLNQLLAEKACEKINIYFKTPELREAYADQLASSAITLVKAERTGLELTAQGADKGAGLQLLCQRLGFGMAEVIGVGDSDNDRTMLQEAGMGLAMGNAKPSIKALANHVVPTNDEGGCVEAIERYLLRS
ncbi:Cof-type HAD-IIB family hydrolase [Streptococcus sp. E17BB]|uniref:Cof-type HAD-IIB family hydrolase n=1 Tax=Streptococcus sp. E17BB TaxID=3278714 RepID=UPI00359CEABA